MKHNWKTCTLDSTKARWSGFHITMNPSGVIYLNGSAMKALNDGERFELLYDDANNTIGLRPSNSLNKNASKAAVKGKHGGKKIRAFRLLQEFQIKLKDTVRFLEPEVDDDGVMILDLRQTTSNSIRKRSA